MHSINKASSANSERSFTTLKRVKAYLKSTMSTWELNNIYMPSIEKELGLSPIYSRHICNA